MRVCVPSVQAAVIVFGSVCVCDLPRIPSVAPCVSVSSLRVSDCDCSVGLGLCVCGCDLPWLCVCVMYLIPSDLCMSDCDFGVCVHVSKSPGVQAAVILLGCVRV